MAQVEAQKVQNPSLAARGGTMFASRDRKRIKKQPSQSRYNAFLMGA
jgi:hypothetical protein